MQTHLSLATLFRPARAGQPQGGFALVAVVAIVTVMLATGLAFMRWNVDEAMQSQQTTAGIQAYYLAQLGIVEQGFQYLRKLPASQLPNAEVPLPGRTLPGFGNFENARYENVRIFWMVPEGETGDFFSMAKRYKILADGVVRVPFIERGQTSYKDVKRRATLYVQVRNFADYMYLSNHEADELRRPHQLLARRHAAGPHALQRPDRNDREIRCFTKRSVPAPPTTITASNANPQFLGSPPTRWGADSVIIPSVAENLRQCAANHGWYFSTPGLSYRAQFTGSHD